MEAPAAVRYNDLVKVPGHKNYYRNPRSSKITFKRRDIRIATGVTQITKAKEFVEQELAKRQGQATSTAAKRLKRVSNPRIADAWQVLIVDDKSSGSMASTMKTYAKDWKYGIAPFWGDLNASDITQENIGEYKRWYQRENPTRYFEKTLIRFQQLLRAMEKARLITVVPDLTDLESVNDFVQRQSKREKVGRRLNQLEIEALQHAAQTYEGTDSRGVDPNHKELLALRTQIAVSLGLQCGMRKMEGLSLEWEHVDLEHSKLRVWSQKNHKWRDVPLIAYLVNLFQRKRAHTGNGRWVFPMPTDPDRHISGQVFDHVWVKVKRNSKIEGRLRYHDLRHTFASITADEGWPPKVACEVLDMSMTTYDRVYCKASYEKKAEWMERTFGGGR